MITIEQCSCCFRIATTAISIRVMRPHMDDVALFHPNMNVFDNFIHGKMKIYLVFWFLFLKS